jgi:NAD(P) transhydrogenase subunit alpha
MSLTNAISAIAVIGAIEIAGEQRTTLSTWLGFLAVILATSNIVGGFMITDRMLKMFKEKKKSGSPAASSANAGSPASHSGTGGAAS